MLKDNSEAVKQAIDFAYRRGVVLWAKLISLLKNSGSKLITTVK
jgi:hypothetical protein